jgi:hypothetical protein
MQPNPCGIEMMWTHSHLQPACVCFNQPEWVVLSGVHGARSDPPLRPTGGGGHRCASVERVLPVDADLVEREGPPLLCWCRALGRGPDARGGEGRDSAAGAGLWRQQRERPVVEWSGRQVSGRPFSHWWADSGVGACLTLCRQHGENLFHVCSTLFTTYDWPNLESLKT